MGFNLQMVDPKTTDVIVVRSPQFSVIGMTSAAAAERTGLGTFIRGWRAPREVVAALRNHSSFALSPLLRQDFEWMPDAVVPIREAHDVGVDEQIEALQDAPDSMLLDELRGLGTALPAAWQAAVDQPGRWLSSMADAAADTWAAMGPIWRRAGPLVDREISRIETALAWGCIDEILDNLNPGITFAVARPTDAQQTGMRVDATCRRVILIPNIVGPDGFFLCPDASDVAYLSYPLPQFDPEEPSSDDALVELLGPVRADVLRQLTISKSSGRLSAALNIAPSTVSYHCGRLERARLVSRERRGQEVIVSLTNRGRELIDLLTP